jgi:hypothetical protein
MQALPGSASQTHKYFSIFVETVGPNDQTCLTTVEYGLEAEKLWHTVLK